MLEEFKKLRRWLRSNCKWDIDEKFVDYGWSYKSIAKYLGTSLVKAFNVVKYAIENGIIKRIKRFRMQRIYKLASAEDYQCTFVSHGLAYWM